MCAIKIALWKRVEKYYFKLQKRILNLGLLDGFQWVGKICKCLFSWRDGQYSSSDSSMSFRDLITHFFLAQNSMPLSGYTTEYCLLYPLKHLLLIVVILNSWPDKSNISATQSLVLMLVLPFKAVGFCLLICLVIFLSSWIWCMRLKKLLWIRL